MWRCRIGMKGRAASRSTRLFILKKIGSNSCLEIWGGWLLHYAGTLASPFQIVPLLTSTSRLFFKTKMLGLLNRDDYRLSMVSY
jgi:hypothetical protein